MLDAFNAVGNMYDLKGRFFADLRDKVPYGDRAKYVRNVAAIENLFFYWKCAELKEAREAWEGSSLAVLDVSLRKSLIGLIRRPSPRISLVHGSLSGYNMQRESRHDLRPDPRFDN